MSYVLHVKVIEAKDIAKMDTFGKSDPYCTLVLGGSKKQKTRVKNNTLTPVWNQTFDFQVADMNSVLHIVMRDEDIACNDDMATLDVSLNSIRPGDVVDNWFPMKPAKGVKKGGMLHLLLHMGQKGEQAFVRKIIQQPMGMQPGMYPPQMGMQPGMQPMGMQPGMYPPQMGMQPGMQQMGMQPGMQPRMGMQPGMQPMGMQPGMQPMGMQPQMGMQPMGMQPQMGMQPGMQPMGMQPQMGMQPGMQPMGMQPGMQPMGIQPPQPGMQPGMYPGMYQPR